MSLEESCRVANICGMKTDMKSKSVITTLIVITSSLAIPTFFLPVQWMGSSVIMLCVATAVMAMITAIVMVHNE
jgi:hypothetical protein